jgi:PAS domain S-box-containing protein
VAGRAVGALGAGGFEVRLAPHPPSVAAARRHVRELLLAADRADLVDSCTLLVSEVVTNALLHAGTDIDLKAYLVGPGIRVEVGDGSPHLPSRRRYAATSGTGRGLQMLEALVDDWGVSRRPDGKTVWFVLAAAPDAVEALDEETAGRQLSGARHRRRGGDRVRVHLLNLPLLVHAAWQEHAEAMLREYVLAGLDDGPDPIQEHAEATSAIAVLSEHLPATPARVIPTGLMSELLEPVVTAAAVDMPVSPEAVAHFATLDRVLDAALLLIGDGVVLTPPAQPEMTEFRRWVCRQVRSQAQGGHPEPWEVPEDRRGDVRLPSTWDPTVVSGSDRGVIAADATSRILAVSAEAARILGYDDPAELVGLRIVSIVPERYRQAHLAGMTMYLLVGRGPLLESPVTIPALRRDGTEVDIELVVHDRGLRDGETVLLADIRPAGTGASGPAG